jgi:serine/threonine-protein kinase HipA
VRYLRLALGERVIGHLRFSEGKSTFIPDEGWAGDLFRPILGQRFEDDPFRRFGTSSRLPAWFSNLLPEGPFRRFVARGNDLREGDEFALLAELGRDLPGALTAVEVTDVDTPFEDVEDADMDEPRRERRSDRVKFSLAGVQMKFSALRTEDRAFVVPVESAGGDWILKLPDLRYPTVPANEYSMLLWASRSGVAVPEIKLVAMADVEGLPGSVSLPPEEPSAFAIARFDRYQNGKQHMEDFAQILDVFPEDKYEHAGYVSLLRVVNGVVGRHAVEEMLKRMVMLIAMDNGDAHLKNWTLRYPEPRVAELSPAYDLVCTGVYIPGDPLALTMDGVRDTREVSRVTFERMIAKADLEPDLIRSVDETVASAAEVWTELREDLPCAPEVKAHIDHQLETSPLFRSTVN